MKRLIALLGIIGLLTTGAIAETRLDFGSKAGFNHVGTFGWTTADSTQLVNTAEDTSSVVRIAGAKTIGVILDVDNARNNAAFVFTVDFSVDNSGWYSSGISVSATASLDSVYAFPVLYDHQMGWAGTAADSSLAYTAAHSAKAQIAKYMRIRTQTGGDAAADTTVIRAKYSINY